MEKHVIDLLTDNILDEAINRWDGNSTSLKLLGDVENFVYEFNDNQKNFILRITHSSHRSDSLIEAELEWLDFLAENQVTVCRPITSINNSFVEIIPLENSYFIVCAFEKAKGQVMYNNKVLEQDENLIIGMGKLAGKLHRVTKNYSPKETKRQQWFEEDNVINSRVYLPVSYTKVHDELDKLISLFKGLPENNDDYGLVHSDIHSGNFFIDGDKITLFDFDDSCYHWYIYDIAIIFYSRVLDFKDENEKNTFAKKFLKLFLDGYSTENNLDEKWLKLLPELFRLREILLYVFLHKKWDLDNLNQKNQEFYNNLKNRIDNNISLIDFAALFN